ncbi:MAG TPA: chaperone modulator CbpM [Polyangiaceae bacterium]|nr:chaperone modulator CbpM [Polyangiaceae bacterium]
MSPQKEQEGTERSRLTLQEVALRAGVDTVFVRRLVELGVIDVDGVEQLFSCEVTLRVQRCVRLQRDLGVNPEGAAVIIELLAHIEALEHELRSLRRG